MWETILGLGGVLIFFTMVIVYLIRNPLRKQQKPSLHQKKRDASFYVPGIMGGDSGDAGDSGD